MKIFGITNIYYELRYWKTVSKVHRFLVLLVTLLSLVIVNLSSAQAFFLSDIIPEQWKILKNKQTARAISIIVIIAPSLLILISDSGDRKEQNKEISKITERITIPFFEEDFNNFYKNTCVKLGLSSGCRMYIVMPSREKFFQWYLRIIAKTNNLEEKETKVLFRLDEGAIGYVFSSMDSRYKYRPEYINLSEVNDLPSDYKHLSANNKALVRTDNKAYLIIPIFDQSFLSSAFVVDTNDSNDFPIFQTQELHQDILNWIGNEPIFLTLIWRLKTNGG